MPQIQFTPHLKRHLACESLDVPGATVAEVLEGACEKIAGLRGYVLDDVGRVRQHVMIFVDDMPLADRIKLSDRTGPASCVYVMQALSGG